MESQHFRPLCPELYEKLVERFGAVRVQNAGEELKANPRIDPATGHVTWDITQKGEHYFVNCPYCNDTRQRLGISYCYGQIDGNTMRAATWLANCFNEECLNRNQPFGLENRADLEEQVFGFLNREDRIGRFPIEPGYVEAPTLAEAVPPGRVVTLDQLTDRHPACRYVEDRGYDPAELGRELGVGYCVEADRRWPAAQGRLIVPITMAGVLVGWQGRYVGDLDWKQQRVSKYYNLPRMAKRLMLYNLDRAGRGRAVVVVEGVTSVWTVGPEAVALLGHDVSARQQQLLSDRWGRKGGLLVLILDPDARAQALRHFPVLQRDFHAYGGAALRVDLPPGKDPADFTRAAVWEMIRAAGARAGVAVDDYLEAAHAD